MANLITLNVDPIIGQRIIDAYAASYGFTGTDEGGSPETKVQFFRRSIIAHIKEAVVSSEANAASSAAAVAARSTAVRDVVIS